MFDPSDPFDAVRRASTDAPGVTKADASRTTPGLIIFHTVVDNKIVVIDNSGDVVMEFAKVPEGYDLYRPGKAGDNRNIYCILKATAKDNERSIASLNEDGDVIWQTDHHHFTHDFHIRHNRRIVTVLRDDRNVDGYLISDNVICEMDIHGKIRWKWSVLDNLDQLKRGREILELYMAEPHTRGRHATLNPFHVNSVQIADYPIVVSKLGEPCIVASARNMNLVFLIGIDSKCVVFEYSGDMWGQHHARVLPEGYADESVGNLIIVDNGYNFQPPERGASRGYSRGREIRIPEGDVCWEYKSVDHEGPPFFSPIVGAQQRFANGNTLITEGYFGRIFEIDHSGEIVWDYVYPECNSLQQHLQNHSLEETGLRQIYRAYKVPHDWMQ